VVKDYESALRRRILPDLGGIRLSDIARRDVQYLADRLVGEGLDASTVRNALMPLRAICRRAVARSELVVNPTSDLELPSVAGRRERIVSPMEASLLLDALPTEDRAVWATAMYGGLRRGELMELRWSDIDLASGVIRVERAWDPKTQQVVAPKSSSGIRRVPIAAVLRDFLIEHKLTRGSEGLAFGRTSELPFTSSLRTRAVRAWKAADLNPIGMHECRHTFASLMIAAGVNIKALSTYMGHASITITLDRYGHLMPGNEDEAAGLLDAYLARECMVRAS
jgi:integrase